MKEDRQYTILYGLLLILTSLFFLGCGNPIRVKEINILQNFYNKIPLKVGLYLSPSFCAYQYRGKSFEFKWVGHYLLGESICQTAPDFFKNSFKEVFIMNEKSIPSNVKLIISPEIIEAETIGPTMATHIIIKWTFANPKGKIYYLNTVKGIGKHDEGFWLPPAAREAFNSTLKDHYHRLYSHMHSTKWWEDVD